MLHSAYYLGLPDEIWQDLLSETEEMLSEEEIGIHILGVYPSGSRIFGIESSSPQFICLYIDVADHLLNPYYDINIDTKFLYYTLKIDNSSVLYIDLYSWIKWILVEERYKYKDKYIQMLDIIPCNQDIIYQDPVINNLIELVKKFTDSFRYILDRGPVCNKIYEENLQCVLYTRTMYNIISSGRFIPNMNKEFGEVLSLNKDIDKEILTLDYVLKDSICQNKKIDVSSLMKYSDKLRIEAINKKKKSKTNKEKLKKEIGKEVAKIYKFIL